MVSAKTLDTNWLATESGQARRAAPRVRTGIAAIRRVAPCVRTEFGVWRSTEAARTQGAALQSVRRFFRHLQGDRWLFPRLYKQYRLVEPSQSLRRCHARKLCVPVVIFGCRPLDNFPRRFLRGIGFSTDLFWAVAHA